MSARDSGGRFIKGGGGSQRFTDPAAFRRALTLKVPATLRALGGRIYLDATLQLTEAVVLATPVDTGYLRAGLGVTSQGNSSDLALPARATDATPGRYSPEAAQAKAKADDAITRACLAFAPVVVGFRAIYAPYVEDKRHMLKSAWRRWREFNRRAVANARSDA